MEHIGDKYFQVTRTQTSVTNEQSGDSKEGEKTKIEVSNPDMDAIYASIAEKTQSPHMSFDNAQFIA
ncbi:hypothetical protein KAZ93_03520 [Patescibacteria group bacterium]|nr:hypothetical protein [Patescibacteria group bacterium]